MNRSVILRTFIKENAGEGLFIGHGSGNLTTGKTGGIVRNIRYKFYRTLNY